MKQVIAFLTAALMLCACGSEQPKTVTFHKVKTTKEAVLDSSANAPSCKVVIEIDNADSDNAETAQAINNAVSQRLFFLEGQPLQQTADSFATQYIKNYGQLKPLYQQDKNDPEKRNWYEYHYTVSTETAMGREGIINYIIHLDYYEGGAHGIQQQLIINFDEQSGKPLTADSVFVPGYQQPLSDLLLQELMDQADVSTLDELRQKDYLYSMDMYPTDNFILGDDAITFIYNPYEIAPYSVGTIKLSLDYSDVKHLMNKDLWN